MLEFEVTLNSYDTGAGFQVPFNVLEVFGDYPLIARI